MFVIIVMLPCGSVRDRLDIFQSLTTVRLSEVTIVV